MNSKAVKFSTTAAAIVTGVGLMQQSSTEMPYRMNLPMVETEQFVDSQTASSVILVDVITMHLIGEDNYQRLLEISRLKYGWDGNKARPIPGSVITRVKELLLMLPNGAKVFPTGRSTVQIEYHKDNDNYFEIEVSRKTYEVYSVIGDNEFEGIVLKKDLKNRVKAFLA